MTLYDSKVYSLLHDFYTFSDYNLIYGEVNNLQNLSLKNEIIFQALFLTKELFLFVFLSYFSSFFKRSRSVSNEYNNIYIRFPYLINYRHA